MSRSVEHAGWELALRAPAKINLSLTVLGRRADGYHEIDTVIHAISLADRLRFRRLARPTLELVCDDPSVPRGRSNLIGRAWRLMRSEFGKRVAGLGVALEKSIPSGAGLGGASSDAAATLIAINRLAGLRLKRAELARIGATLGSDVPFFIYGGAARCRGRGEIIEPIASRLAPMSLVIVFPEFESSTQEAYALLRPGDFTRRSGAARVARHLALGNAGAIGRSVSNTFDRVLTEGDARYGRIERAMRMAGIARPMLSGSGSACFGFVPDGVAARAARNLLVAEYPRTFHARMSRSIGIRREPVRET